MNRRLLPLFMMLVAGLVTVVITFIRQYSIVSKLWILFVVMLVFWGMGSIITKTLDYFDKVNLEKQKQLDEVIEKEGEEQNSDETDSPS